MPRVTNHSPSTLLAVACASGILSASPLASGAELGPRLSLDSVEQGKPSAASEPVAYRDLDLSTKAGQVELQRRVRRTAARLCHRLHPDVWKDGLAYACEEEAISDATSSEAAIIAKATVRSYAVAARH